MASTVVTDSFGQRRHGCHHLLKCHRGHGWIGYDSTVEVGDIGLMVAAMMDPHGLSVNHRLQRASIIRKFRQTECRAWQVLRLGYNSLSHTCLKWRCCKG